MHTAYLHARADFRDRALPKTTVTLRVVGPSADRATVLRSDVRTIDRHRAVRGSVTDEDLTFSRPSPARTRRRCRDLAETAALETYSVTSFREIMPSPTPRPSRPESGARRRVLSASSSGRRTRLVVILQWILSHTEFLENTRPPEYGTRWRNPSRLPTRAGRR